jgi:cytoskeletal protein RodZ
MRKISEMLSDARIEKKYSLEDVVKAIKIKKEFLIAIEDGRYHDLPSESYALGFVKNYASFVGIEKNKAAALFRREYVANKSKILPTFKSQNSQKLSRKILFTPRSFIIAILLLVFVGYIAFQYSSFFLGPKLEVKAPLENAIVTDNIVDVSGTTDPYATVLINNEEAYVNLDGSFKKTLYLYTGTKQIEVISKNRNGKDTKKIIDVKVQ